MRSKGINGIGRAREVDCLDEGTAQEERQHVKHETGAEKVRIYQRFQELAENDLCW